MNPRTRDLNLIIEHFRKEKWFKDALAAFKKEREARTERAAKITAREAEWKGLPPAEQAMVLRQIKKEIDG